MLAALLAQPPALQPTLAGAKDRKRPRDYFWHSPFDEDDEDEELLIL